MKQPTLKQLKTSFKSITKNIKMRPLMQKLIVDDSTIKMTDVDTQLIYKNAFDMGQGMQSLDTLGLVESIELDVDYPLEVYNREHSTRDKHSMTTKELEYFIKFMSKDETRLHFNGVGINGGYFVATDGHKLVKRVLGEVNDIDVIIPSEGLKTLLKLLKVHKLESFYFETDIEFTVIDCEYFNLSLRNINREYAKWSGVVPVKTAHSFIINNWINFKELKALFRNTNFGLKITTLDGLVNVQIIGHDKSYLVGSCSDTEKNITIGINASYLNDIINGQELTTFKYNSEYAPILFNNESGEGVVMPLKI